VQREVQSPVRARATAHSHTCRALARRVDMPALPHDSRHNWRIQMIEIDGNEMQAIEGGNACGDFFSGVAVGLGLAAAYTVWTGAGGAGFGLAALVAKGVGVVAC
jgi:hypothetical protein